MSDKTELPTCGSCRWWGHCAGLDAENDAVTVGVKFGYCHRFPPVYTPVTGDQLAMMNQDNWSQPVTMSCSKCGEWRATAVQMRGSPMDLAYHAEAVNMSTEDLERVVRYKSTATGMRAAVAAELARRYAAQRAADIAFARLQHNPAPPATTEANAAARRWAENEADTTSEGRQ